MNSIGQTVFELSPETKMWTNRWMRRQTDKNGQTKERNFTNLERNLAMMVMYAPVKFEFDWTNCFRVRVRKQKCGRTDGWTEKRTKNKQMDRKTDKRTDGVIPIAYFERNLAMMVMYVPVKFEFDWTNRFRVRDRKQKCGRTDG